MDQGGTATGTAGAAGVTRWLDEEEQRTWRAFMLSHVLLFEQFERDLQREAGLPVTYYEIMVRLSEAPDHRLRMSELADRSQSSRSRLSHAVARLEESGWVRRESCPTDRRGSIAVLTDEGYAALRGGGAVARRERAPPPLRPALARAARRVARHQRDDPPAPRRGRPRVRRRGGTARRRYCSRSTLTAPVRLRRAIVSTARFHSSNGNRCVMIGVRSRPSPTKSK